MWDSYAKIQMTKITIPITVWLEPKDLNHPIKVRWLGQDHEIHKEPLLCESHCVMDLEHLNDHTEICHFTGFVGGETMPCIKIRPVTVGDVPVQDSDFFGLAADNGTTITNCHEVTQDGSLTLQARSQKHRLFWAPWYQSDHRSDFVFENELLDDWGSTVRPWRVGMFGPQDHRISRKLYLNQPHLPQAGHSPYDLATFGCSITFGNALDVGTAWPELLKTDSVLNLGVPGLGIDGCLLQLITAERHYDWKRTVILLPNPERGLIRFRVPQTGQWMRIPLSATLADWSHHRLKDWAWSQMGILMTRSDIQSLREQFIRASWDIIMSETQTRSWRCLDRLIKVCERQGKPYWIGSWDEDTNHRLQERLDPQHRLPRFRKTDHALDGSHPGPLSHKLWADQIQSIITG